MKEKKKLQLSRETVRALTVDELRRAVGGYARDTEAEGCVESEWFTCNACWSNAWSVCNICADDTVFTQCC